MDVKDATVGDQVRICTAGQWTTHTITARCEDRYPRKRIRFHVEPAVPGIDEHWIDAVKFRLVRQSADENMKRSEG